MQLGIGLKLQRPLPNRIPNFGQSYYYDGTISGGFLVANQGGIDIPVVSGSGATLVLDMSVLDGTTASIYNKENILGGSTGFEYWDSPGFTDYGNKFYWGVEELNYRFVENLWISTTNLNQIFAALNYSAGTLQGLTELLLFDNIVADVTVIKNYIKCNQNAIDFDGVNQHAVVADNGALDIVEAPNVYCSYISIFTKDVSTLGFLFGKSVLGNVTNRYGFFIDGGYIKLLCQVESEVIIIQSLSTVAQDTKYNLLLKVDLDAKLIYFYIEGVLQNAGGTLYTGSFSNLANQFEFYLAASSNSTGSGVTSYKSVVVIDARIYHKDVASNFDKLNNREVIGDEVAWWKCDEIVGTTISDETGNYDLTAVNNPEVVTFYINEI